jgi:DNA-binding MarR family transcriptional regulator
MVGDTRKERSFSTYRELARALEKIDSLMAQQLANYGLTAAQFRILEEVLHAGTAEQVRLAPDKLGGPSSTSKILARMEQQELVVRSGHGEDGRKLMVQLTPRGKALIEEVLPRQSKLIRAQMAALMAREQDTLRRLCKKLSVGNPRRFISVLTQVDDGEE